MSAAAYDFKVSARTAAYGYQLRRLGKEGVGFLNRRRITQYLGLRVFNLLDPGQRSFGRKGKEPPALLTFHALMRFDTDFGSFVSPAEDILEIENNQLDLMVGALEGRNILGWVDFTLGRQFDAEMMDFFAYDGLRIRLNSPWRLFVEAHVGAQTSRVRPFSSTVFETDGVSGDATDDAWSPTFGAAVGLEDWRGLSARVAYRGTASVAPQAGEGTDTIWGVDQELVFLSASYQVPVLGLRPMIGARYDVLTGEIDDLQATLIQQLGGVHDLQLEYLWSRPHFDGDSIFNIFSTEPFHDIAFRYAIRAFRSLRLSGRLGYRRFWRDEDEASPDAYTVALGGWWRTERLRAGVDVFYLGGQGRTTVGGEVDCDWTLTRWLALEGRLSLVQFQVDDPERDDVMNFGFQAGAVLMFFKGVKVHVLIEDNISQLYSSAFRLLAIADLEFAP